MPDDARRAMETQIGFMQATGNLLGLCNLRERVTDPALLALIGRALGEDDSYVVGTA